MDVVERCPACDGRRLLPITARGKDLAGERVAGCLGCGACFLSPRMDAAELATYYRDAYARAYRGSSTPSAADIAARDPAAAYRADLLARWGVLAPGRTVLEIGCGAGNFLDACRARGLEAWGVEPGAGWAAAATARGLAVEVGAFPARHGPHRGYDVIALFHVLEHLPHALDALRAARDLLVADGTLVVEVPELGRALGPRWSERYFHRPHLVDYTERALEALLERAGFAPVAHDYCRAHRRRRHHLLVTARPARPRAPGAHPFAAAATLARVRGWIGVSRVSRPIALGLRRIAAGRGGRGGSAR